MGRPAPVVDMNFVAALEKAMAWVKDAAPSQRGIEYLKGKWVLHDWTGITHHRETSMRSAADVDRDIYLLERLKATYQEGQQDDN